MGLVYWAPMTDGTVKNQGIITTQPSSTESSHYTSSTAGKLGKCIKTNSSDYIETSIIGDWVGEKSNTLAGWFYFPYDEIKAIVDASTNPSAGSPVPTGTLLGYCHYAGIALSWYTNKPMTTFYAMLAIRTGSSLYTAGLNLVDSNLMDKWVHLAGIWDNDNLKIKFFVNGSEVRQVTIASQQPVKQHLQINRNIVYGGNGPACRIPFYCNDLRVYKDEILSDRDIKHLAEGLTLHYPLSNRGFGGDNLLLNTNFSLQTTNFTTWNTEKNGTHYATYWGGYNGGVVNPTTCYHAHLVLFQGEWVYEYTRDTETWLGISQSGLQSVIQPNTTYTWSIDEYRPTGANNYITAGLYYKKTSDGSNGFHSGCPHGNGSDVRDQWVRRTYTFTTGEVYTGASIWFYIYGHSNGAGTVYMRRPKLEKGSVATPWVPNSSDPLYSFLQLNSTTELDCSGYQYNGTRNGILINSESPINQGCYIFNGTDSWIRTTANTQHIGTGDFTISAWINLETSSKTYQPVISNKTTAAVSVGCAIYFNHSQNKFLWSTADGSAATEIWTANTFADIYNKWTHVVMVRNSSDAKKGYFYINGVRQELASVPAIRNISTTHELVIGALYTDAANYRWTGKISDVRMYATALNENAIKDLYMMGGGVV